MAEGRRGTWKKGELTKTPRGNHAVWLFPCFLDRQSRSMRVAAVSPDVCVRVVDQAAPFSWNLPRWRLCVPLRPAAAAIWGGSPLLLRENLHWPGVRRRGVSGLRPAHVGGRRRRRGELLLLRRGGGGGLRHGHDGGGAGLQPLLQLVLQPLDLGFQGSLLISQFVLLCNLLLANGRSTRVRRVDLRRMSNSKSTMSPPQGAELNPMPGTWCTLYLFPGMTALRTVFLG